MNKFCPFHLLKLNFERVDFLSLSSKEKKKSFISHVCLQYVRK